MDYELVIAFQRLEEKIDDIGLMVAELVKAKREQNNEEKELTEEEKVELEIESTKKKGKKNKAEVEEYPEYN